MTVYVQLYSAGTAWHALASALAGGKVIALCRDAASQNVGVWIRTDAPDAAEMCSMCARELRVQHGATDELDPETIRIPRTETVTIELVPLEALDDREVDDGE